MTVKKQIAELETLLTDLENEEIELDDAFKLYEKALTIASKTASEIEKQEKTFTKLTQKHNKIIEQLQTINQD